MDLSIDQAKLVTLIDNYYQYEETQVAPVELRGYHSYWPKYEQDYPDDPNERPEVLGDRDIYDFIFGLFTKLEGGHSRIIYLIHSDAPYYKIRREFGFTNNLEIERFYRAALDDMLANTTLSKIDLYFSRI